MKLTTSILALALVTAPSFGAAQFDVGGGSSSSAANPWDGFKLNSKTRIKLDYRNANVDLVLSVFQKSSGVTIVKDPALVGGITITSAGPVSLKDAFQILSTTLSLKNYDLKKEGTLLVIRQRKQETRSGGMMGGFDPSMLANLGGGGDSTDKNSLRVYQVTYASASEVARVVNEVFTQDQSASTNPIARMFGAIGGAQGGRGRFGQAGGGGFNFGGANRSQGPSVRASYDDFSNSVIVNAPSKQQRDVEDLIKKIDKITDKPVKTRVHPLKYASATDLVTTIQNVVTSNAPTGRGTQRNTNQGGGGFGFFGGFGQNRNQQTQVTADTRSNSVIVTTTEENQDIVAKVIDELDKPAQTANGTFVYTLENARADNVATILNNAFGTRSGTNANRNTGTNTTGRTTGTTNRTTGGNNRPTSLTGSAAPDPNTGIAQSSDKMELALREPSEFGGELMTSVSTTQGGFFQNLFGGGQNRNQQSSTDTVGRDAQGRLINVRDAVGKVTVIADPTTNSVIIVASPDIADLVKNVLQQLDQIPQQVMIETLIVEATLNSTDKFGFEWTYNQDKAFGTPGANGKVEQAFGLKSSNPNGIRYTLTSGNLTAFVNAIKTDRRFDVLSTPRIFTSNNVEAQINISQSIPYILSQRTDTSGAITYNYAFQDVGIVLTVTPRITSNGYVTMDVSQTANDLEGYTDFNAPIVNQRQAETTVSVRDGETIVLGGIIRNTVTTNVSKLPLLGDLPILGKLFQNSTKSKDKTELLVFLTPRVVKNPADAKLLKDETIKGLSGPNQKAAKDNLPKPISKPLPEAKDGGIQ